MFGGPWYASSVDPGTPVSVAKIKTQKISKVKKKISKLSWPRYPFLRDVTEIDILRYPNKIIMTFICKLEIQIVLCELQEMKLQLRNPHEFI